MLNDNHFDWLLSRAAHLGVNAIERCPADIKERLLERIAISKAGLAESEKILKRQGMDYLECVAKCTELVLNGPDAADAEDEGEIDGRPFQIDASEDHRYLESAELARGSR